VTTQIRSVGLRTQMRRLAPQRCLSAGGPYPVIELLKSYFGTDARDDMQLQATRTFVKINPPRRNLALFRNNEISPRPDLPHNRPRPRGDPSMFPKRIGTEQARFSCIGNGRSKNSRRSSEPAFSLVPLGLGPRWCLVRDRLCAVSALSKSASGSASNRFGPL